MVPNEVISAARALLSLVIPSGDTLLIARIEQFSTPARFNTELIQGIGRPAPDDVVVNNHQGSFRWTRAFSLDQKILDVMTPDLSAIAEFQAFSLLVHDLKTGKPIALCVGCAPDSIDTAFDNSRAVRENYSGLARMVLRGEEIARSAGGGPGLALAA